MKTFTQISLSLIVVMSTLLFTGCSKTLDKETATEVILKQLKFPGYECVQLGCGEVKHSWMTAGKHKEFLDLLKEKNIIDYQSHGRNTLDITGVFVYTVSLTPEGEKLKTGEGEFDIVASQPVLLKTSEFHFNGISNIRKIEGDNYFEVSYTCVQHLTPFGEALNEGFMKKNKMLKKYHEGKIWTYTVRLVDTDTGWVVMPDMSVP
jgi:hypothetical protein